MWVGTCQPYYILQNISLKFEQQDRIFLKNRSLVFSFKCNCTLHRSKVMCFLHHIRFLVAEICENPIFLLYQKPWNFTIFYKSKRAFFFHHIRFLVAQICENPIFLLHQKPWNFTIFYKSKCAFFTIFGFSGTNMWKINISVVSKIPEILQYIILLEALVTVAMGRLSHDPVLIIERT